MTKGHLSAAVISVFLVAAANRSQAQTLGHTWADHDMSRGLNISQQFGLPVAENGLFKNAHFDFRDRSVGLRDNSLLAQNLLSGGSPQWVAGWRLLQMGKSFQSSSAAVRSNVVFPIAPPPAPVTGSGTIGQITKWIGINPNGAFILGDSVITELNGNIGIGTTTPASMLTVAGMIESTSGGFRFPDGTLQTRAGISAVAHNSTLAGGGIIGSPLGVAVPLFLSGSVGFPDAVIRVTNTAELGTGVRATGGSSRGDGGRGVHAIGGFGGELGGAGVAATGGDSEIGFGGPGVFTYGGDSNRESGGDGVVALGGTGSGEFQHGGFGIVAQGGRGMNGASEGAAGFFYGNVYITGTLAKAAGSFKIDHPLDPENKYLSHSFVESPDMMNIYNGNVTTDQNGEANVTLPDYFEALNKVFRYQLTVIGTFAQAIIASKIKDNSFTIQTNAPNVEVSWQVTGIRQDAYANKHRIPVEEKKSDQERGYYIHPEVFDQPADKGIEWVRNPALMRKVKNSRDQIKQKSSTRDR
jgi:hypothetical protein